MHLVLGLWALGQADNEWVGADPCGGAGGGSEGHGRRRFPVLSEGDQACLCAHRKVYDWRLIFGASEIVYGNDKPAKPPQQERYVEKIIIHEKYVPSLEHNDIALMKITPPVPCGQFIGTGCLPQFRAGPPRIPQVCWVAGWGFLKEKGEYRRGSHRGGGAAGHGLSGL